MHLGYLLSPIVAFFVFLLVGRALYALGNRMAGPATVEPGKDEPYACGEPYEAGRFQFGYSKFFISALFFTIMHVAALTIATVPAGAGALKALLYLGAIAISIFILFVDFD